MYISNFQSESSSGERAIKLRHNLCVCQIVNVAGDKESLTPKTVFNS